jgi:hypothetical protein
VPLLEPARKRRRRSTESLTFWPWMAAASPIVLTIGASLIR